MKTETIRLMLDYHIWANRQLWDCIESLSDEQFTQEHGHSIGSVHNQAFHLMFTDWYTMVWLEGRVPAKDDPAFLNQESYPDRIMIREKWDKLEGDLNAFVESLTDEKLAEAMTVPMGDDVEFDTNWGEILLTTVNHGTNHRAQTLSVINELGGETVEQGLFFYLMQRS
ncbi:MAG: hypothetical protein DWQ04_23660 [Chloroflexi bacterium]|nr:MAG: hypothetical protein DWQ04_23660 [Chloroflexota bacterium]